MYIIDKYSDDLIVLAYNTLEKFIKEKWDKLGSVDNKEIIRRFLINNLTHRLNCLKGQLSQNVRQSLIRSINQINIIIILIAQKEWLKTWNNLITDLCEQAKNDLSYICVNNMKILIELSDDINKYWKHHMTCTENINLTYKMNEELNKIFDLCQFILINKSSHFIAFLEKNNILNVNNNNYINNGDNINAEKIQIIIDILKQTIKLFKEYINWFEYDKIFDLNIIEHLLHVFKYCDPCKVELIECFGKLFELKISEIQYTDEETLRGIIFGVYNQFIDIIHNVIIKKKNLSDTYQKLIEESPALLKGYEIFIINLEKCLINFFEENFDYIKKKNNDIALKNNNIGVYNSALEFFKKYTNNMIIGLNYLLQITDMKSGMPESENDQIYDNAIEFWFGIVYKLFTLKKQSNHNNNNYSQNNEINNDDNIELLIAFLKNSVLYNNCFMEILDNLRILLCLNMAKPLELKIILDENGDIAYDPDSNGSFNQNLHDSMKKTLIYLSLIEPEKTKDLIADQLILESKVAKNTNKINCKRVCCLCWSSGLISGSMNEKLEYDLIVIVFRLLFAMMGYCADKKDKSVCAYNLLFVASQYPNFFRNRPAFLESIFKKIFQLIKINSEFIQDFSCETLLKLSNDECSRDLLTNPDNNNRGVPVFVFLLNDLNDLTKNLKTYMIYMIYESLANIIDKETNMQTKQSYFKELMKKPNETFNHIINMKNNNINTLNDVNILKDIRKFLHINERICFALKKFYWLYGSYIFKDIINIYIYYNQQINVSISNNNCNINNVKKRDYELINSSILKYFISLVKNINDIQIINNDMIMNYGFGELINQYNNNPTQNKDPNMLLLFTAIIDVFKNQYPNICCTIWDCFSSNIFKIIQNNYKSFPELFENFFKFIKSIVTNSLESIYYKKNEIPQLLIDILIYGINDKVPCVYENSLEAIQNLLNYILNPNLNKISQQKFFNSHLYKIFGQVFSTMVDGFHQNGINLQIKIIQLIIKTIDDEKYFNKNEKLNFRQIIIDNLPSICPNMNKNQIQTFCYAIFNYSGNEHNFKITIKDFLTSQKTFRNEDEPIYEEEKEKQIKLAKEIELKREKDKYLPPPQNNERYSVVNYQMSDSLN